MNFRRLLKHKAPVTTLCALILLGCIIFLSGCTTPQSKPMDSDTAIEYLWELKEYVERTGNTDIYLYFLEDMNSEYLESYLEDKVYSGYLDEYIEDAYASWFEDAYMEGYSDGYGEGFSDGSRLIIDYMDEDYREEWWNKNIDMIMEYGIEY